MTHSTQNQTRPSRRRGGALAAVAVAATTIVVPAGAAGAVPAATPDSVIDDFNDGDASDWTFFGGNAAGGGGGAADDRPYEGSHYLSTGWGGEGSNSVFYGGSFKNFDDNAQVAVPADPWFNVWVLNQSNATVDQYTIEITLREDLDGNGWTDGAEDSVRLDTTFTSADFDDEWTLVSAPLSSFTNQNTGGNGLFDGDLDEVVLVIAGVDGAPGSAVEVDFDQFGFSSGAPVAVDTVVFDDMEHGDPFGNGWFAFDGDAGGGIGADTDVPPDDGGAFSLAAGWGSGGTPGFFGGFGRTNAVDVSGAELFNFWIDPDAGQDYTLEINLQDDDNGDGAINPPDDDEFQFNCVVSDTGPCAVAGGGWQLVSIPLADFFDDGSFLFGGNGVLDPTSVDRGGNGELVNVVFAIVSNSGADTTFRTDRWTFSREPITVDATTIVDDFENGLPTGAAVPNGEPVGFSTFQGADSSIGITTTDVPPAPAPAGGPGNDVLQMTVDSTAFAGYIHAFENDALDAWVTQDWSRNEGIRFWMYGLNTGAQMFIDILDNRGADSTTDDAERWSVPFVDDVAGWHLREFPFPTFVRKEIGNQAPNDGLGLFEMHGYAIGTLGTPGEVTYWFDDVEVYGVAEPPALAVNLAQQNTFVEEGETGEVLVKLNRPMGPDDPEQVSIDFATERSYAVAGEEYTPTSGTLTFVNGGASEQSFTVETFDDTKFEGDEQIVIRLSNPVDVERGNLFQGSVLIDDDDEFDPDLLDDFTQGAFLWDATGSASIDAVQRAASDTDARPGQDAVERMAQVDLPIAVDIDVRGKQCRRGWAWLWGGRTNGWGFGLVTVHLLSSPDFDATTVDVSTVRFGEAGEAQKNRRTGEPRRRVRDVNRDGLDDLVFKFRRSQIGVDCRDAVPFSGMTESGQAITTGGADAALVRDFPIGQDWSDTETLSFWYEGSGGGEDVVVTLKDNRAADPGPSGWTLAWADEFDEVEGTVPNPANWSYEIGDTTPDGKNGWGNEELQYYTDDPANAHTDGEGNLVITLDEAESGQECYYGPCEFESARLITQNKAEFAYGRIESRLKVPTGGDGLWPAFWSLGTDITYNPWPGAGEIDIMEYVSRLPNEIFGTVHGPGYSGGGSIGDIYTYDRPVYEAPLADGAGIDGGVDGGTGPSDDGYHTFTVEWEPQLITWYVDDVQYHQVTPADVPGPWVFEKPFFLLLNFAIGGNFGGSIDPDNTYPQEYLVDYVRVYQGPDTAERFETSFVDDVDGWKQVTIPIDDFVRSDDQPAGAPDDGLTLSDVWGYGFEFPNGNASGSAAFDFVERNPVPPPSELTVASTADAGEGSLRAALAQIADGGTITLDSTLAGQTIALAGELVADRSVTIDGSAAPGVVLSGENVGRVLRVTADSTVAVNDVVFANGVAGPQGGGIFNAGTLDLDRVVVRDNVVTAAGPPNFELGGGGVYNAAGAVMTLTDSTVVDNETLNHPGGGVYGFFGSSLTIERSTISGNVAGDVAGGIRSLGNTTIVNSTISGNTSSAWHGGGAFLTDGNVTISNSTIVGNISPGGTAGGLMVATFGAPVDVTITDNVIADNGTFNCQIEGDPSVAVLTSGGGNVATDSSCALVPTDQDVGAGGAGVGPLVDNGGSTETHALLAGSPAIDAAIGSCPATDQRGVTRPQGAGCDVGAVEVVT